mgnify:CR=1 FL=1
MELSVFQFVVLIALAFLGIGVVIFCIVSLLVSFFSIPNSLDRIDDGQDDEIELLEEIRDAIKKKE